MNPPNNSFFMMADSLFDSPDSLFSKLLPFENHESAPSQYESAILTNLMADSCFIMADSFVIMADSYWLCADS